MNTIKITTRSPQETQKLGQRLAKKCKGGEIFCLLGNLGSGKTTFVKGVARALRIDEKRVNSPTFVLMNAYQGRLALYHFDFYRLNDPKEIGEIGYDEFLYGNGVAVIEWAERFGPLMPPECLAIEFSEAKEQSRTLKLMARGKKYQDLLGGLKQ